MEASTMGRTVVNAKIENLGDLYSVEQGLLTPDKVRRTEVTDALVDTGATMLSLPARLIKELGLRYHRRRRVRTSAGIIDCAIHDAVRLTVQGRDCTVDVAEVPDECPVLIGQVPLELLDFVVDPAGQKLIGNPAHGGEHMIEQY
jgi:predicted aspartyl protease